MRVWPLIALTFAGLLSASEQAYPLWDGHESVADYAKHVNLPPTKTLDLGGGVKLELVLIPTGKFIMGTGAPVPTEPTAKEPPEPAEPPPVDEDGFRNKIFIAQFLLTASTITFVFMLCGFIDVAIRKRQMPKYSLLWIVLMAAMAGGCVLSGLRWRQSVENLEEARVQYSTAKDAARAQYTAAKERFNAARAQYKAAKQRFDAEWAKKRSDPAHWWDRPPQPVTLTQPFYMGKFAITQKQYQQVIGTNPSHFIGKDNPVETVSWRDVEAFCKKATEQSKQTVRLSTEAEWEYACRAGTTSTYYSGDTEADLGRVAWYSGNSENTTHPVGQRASNRFGLYDMLGNVRQWCSDLLDVTDRRALCGSSWNDDPEHCHSAERNWRCYADRDEGMGFRVVVPALRTP